MALAEHQITLEIVNDGALDEKQIIRLENLNTDVNGGIGYILSDITGDFGEDEIYVDVDTFSAQGVSQVFTYSTAWSPSLDTWGIILEDGITDGITFAAGDTFTVTIAGKEGVTGTLEAQGESIVEIGTAVQQQEETLAEVQDDIDEVATAIAKELVASGYAKITASPSVELGKTDSAWKMLITNTAIELVKDLKKVATLGQDPENLSQTILKADNARLATVKLRSANADSICILGIVAQSNGHISLKEI